VEHGRFRVEPLGDHDRDSFISGTAELDQYLHRQASQDVKRKVAAPFVMVDASRQIVGYYTLSAYEVRTVQLPDDLARKLSKYPLIPATLLRRLAASQQHQGKQLGKLLRIDTLYRS